MSEGIPGATALTHHLVVSDLARASAFYLEVMGASLYGEYGGTSVVLEWMGAWVLLTTGGEPTADKPTVTFAAPTDPDTVSAQRILRVDSCQHTYDVLVARGAVFLTPPVDHGYEIRAFFRDPDGHLFELSELVQSS